MSTLCNLSYWKVTRDITFKNYNLFEMLIKISNNFLNDQSIIKSCITSFINIIYHSDILEIYIFEKFSIPVLNVIIINIKIF